MGPWGIRQKVKDNIVYLKFGDVADDGPNLCRIKK